MKILHLSDLHIGKTVNEISMLKSQEFVLNQALELIKNKNIEAVFISGDVFDRPIPSINALELFDNFVSCLVNLNQKIYIISGNHDNLERLSYLSNLLKKSNVFISQSFTGKLRSYPLKDNIQIYLMPYLYPAIIRKYFPENKIENYNDAIKVLLDNTETDENKINILLAHQFCTSKNEVILSESEEKSVGGVDVISDKVFEKFDYTALGHLHCPQNINSKVRYGGSILKYSFSEINQNKSFTVLNIENDIKIETYPIKFLHEMKEYTGYIEEFLNEDYYSKIKTDDFIHFILKDEMVIEAKNKLSAIYPNIMLLEFDNSFTKNLNTEFNFNKCKDKSILEHFKDFYKLQTKTDLDDEKEKLLSDVINSKEKEEDECAR